MGREFYERFEPARAVFDAAERALPGLSMKALCFEANEEELTKTEHAQPALYTASYAAFSVLREMGYSGEVFAGHSLGEYTAIAAAGYLAFEDGLRLVRKRGLLMRDCDPGRKGGMAAVIGLDYRTIEKACAETGEVFPANVNSPSQIVISGLRESVERACMMLSELGAKRTVILNVSGAFHSPFMEEAAWEMEKELEQTSLRRGKGRVISNATAELTDEPEGIKKNLVEQLRSPVLWSASMLRLLKAGYRACIEAGPGGVLKGLMRSIAKEVRVISVEKPEDLQALER